MWLGAAGGLSEVADCGAGWQTVEWGEPQLAGKAAPGRLGDRLLNPEFQLGEIKPQTTD